MAHADADNGATDSRLSAPGFWRPIEGTTGRHRDVQGTTTDNPVLIMVLRLAQVSRGPPTGGNGGRFEGDAYQGPGTLCVTGQQEALPRRHEVRQSDPDGRATQ